MYLLAEMWMARFRRATSGVQQIVLGVLCIAFGLLYYFTREENYSWTLQDILCPMLCIYIIRTFTVPNLKVAFILLTLLICYDIFWVYISPYMVELFSSDSGSESTAMSGLRMLQSAADATALASGQKSTDPNDSVMVCREMWPRIYTRRYTMFDNSNAYPV